MHRGRGDGEKKSECVFMCERGGSYSLMVDGGSRVRERIGEEMDGPAFSLLQKKKKRGVKLTGYKCLDLVLFHFM